MKITVKSYESVEKEIEVEFPYYSLHQMADYHVTWIYRKIEKDLSYVKLCTDYYSYTIEKGKNATASFFNPEDKCDEDLFEDAMKDFKAFISDL